MGNKKNEKGERISATYHFYANEQEIKMIDDFINSICNQKSVRVRKGDVIRKIFLMPLTDNEIKEKLFKEIWNYN